MPRCLQQNSQQMVLLMAGRRVTRDLEAVTTHLSADLQLPKHPLMKTITVFHHRNVRYHICPIAMKTNAALIILISIVVNIQSPPLVKIVKVFIIAMSFSYNIQGTIIFKTGAAAMCPTLPAHWDTLEITQVVE